MIHTKLFEVRDRATFIPVLAVMLDAYANETTDAERYLMRRVGYGVGQLVALTRLSADDAPTNYDPSSWRNQRTWGVAHRFIAEHWDELSSGDVVDVEFIIGESSAPKTSERIEAPL